MSGQQLVPASALSDTLGPKARKTVYLAYTVAGLAIGATQAGYVAAGEQPTWLSVVLGVFGFLSAPIGLLAASNTPSAQPRRALVEEEGEEAE